MRPNNSEVGLKDRQELQGPTAKVPTASRGVEPDRPSSGNPNTPCCILRSSMNPPDRPLQSHAANIGRTSARSAVCVTPSAQYELGSNPTTALRVTGQAEYYVAAKRSRESPAVTLSSPFAAECLIAVTITY
jgi:hypothetical protein